MIDDRYHPADIEPRVSAEWERANAFRAGLPDRRTARPFSMVIPPPNVTGSLHMGHALNNTLQDVLARFERMRGRDVLWQPGTDHAGIATQMVVERQMMERQEPDRRTIGREKFLEKVWAWKAESGGTIVNQLKRLGASCDWSRERFTMDEGLSRAVVKVFVDLYQAGLIYKDKRLVNWDPKLLTAISDLEVQQVEVKGRLWYLRYPLEGRKFDPKDPATFIVVATTRPETMLGDVAVAVHPENARLKHLIGRHAILPLVGRRIPIIGDDYADPEKGTGAVKITPAHDFNDFEVGKRHHLPLINVLDRNAKLWLVQNQEFRTGIPWSAEIAETLKLSGVDRLQARKQIVARLEENGFLEKVEPHTHTVPHGDRSGAVVEPFLTDQWYVDAKTLAQPAITAVREGKTTFVPKNWEKTYFDWMENIQPWCISRQLWWGHQIPAWYGPSKLHNLDGKGWNLDFDERQIFVAINEKEAIAQAEDHYGRPVQVAPSWNHVIRAWHETEKFNAVLIARDEDVLDTWFSSALWPFSTLGWPDKTRELSRYYPTNVLVTGFDIIFFWVARMMMMGLYFVEKAPFQDVYIHALVRDEKGAKMSKSKGNVIDPLHLIDEYGADALRFTLAAMAAQGRDIKLSEQRVAGYRNFATKLWNACRFAEINECVRPDDFDPKDVTSTLNRWIAHETSRASREATEAIKDYKFNDAADTVYRFVWSIFCDWYLELAKPVLAGSDPSAAVETRAMIAWVRDQILKLLHPFMPFITEELWRVTASSVISTDRLQSRSVGRVKANDPGRFISFLSWNSESPDLLLSPQNKMERQALLALAQWPNLSNLEAEHAEAEIGWIIDLVTSIRSVRTELNVPASAKVPLGIMIDYSEASDLLPILSDVVQRWKSALMRLARLSAVNIIRHLGQMPGQVNLVVRGIGVTLNLTGIIDLTAERIRLEKEMRRIEEEIKRVDAKLSNRQFVERAPEEVIDGEREKREIALAERSKLSAALERLTGPG